MDSHQQDERGASAIATAQPSKGPLHSDHQDELTTQSLEKDAAAAIVPDHAVRLDKAEEHRVQRKIDRFLIPVMWFGYGLVYYDKVLFHIPTPSQLPLTGVIRPS